MSDQIMSDQVMSDQIRAGAVLYARDVERLQTFYRAVTGFAVEHAESDHVVLESPSFQLVILKIPERIAASIPIETPPRRRTDTPVKLVFFVADLVATRAIAALQGGELNPSEKEWAFQGCRVCDGQDPEGNVIQFRQKVCADAAG